MTTSNVPNVDLIVLTRNAGPLSPQVQSGLNLQHDIRFIVHRVVGQPHQHDRCRYETIARARNIGKRRGNAPWLMFVDDDVMLQPRCVSTLVRELARRPAFAALAADYLGESGSGRIARHVSMGATLFRREALEQIRFTWAKDRCECQCCCDDLRRRRWGIDYCLAAHARHLPKSKKTKQNSSSSDSATSVPIDQCARTNQLAATAATPSVCLVACYFGPLPGWIQHYLLSCQYNPTVDFLIITDQSKFPRVPANVRVRHLSAAGFNKLATEVVGFEVRLRDARKLCDFKPVYGHLFEKLLKGWDYWGYTDLDVVYGNIRKFLTAAKVQKYDVFTARKEFLVGHFTLLRNNDRMRKLYQQSVDIKNTLQSPHVLSFDECGYQWVRRMRGIPLNGDAACQSMTHLVHKLMAQGNVSARFTKAVIEWPELTSRGWRLRWNSGKLEVLHQRREAMYFHFHLFKRRRGYRAPPSPFSQTVFDMSPNGFEQALDRSRANV